MYKVGNEIIDIQKYLNPRTKIYKTMKLEIEKKLENENWLSILGVPQWKCQNYSLDHQLSYPQVDDIVKLGRKQNCLSSETYVINNPNNKNGRVF